MSVTIKEVKTKSELKKFVKFPFGLYRGNAYWIPPIISDEVKVMLPETNPAFEFSDAKFWIAEKDGKIVGRIGAIINKLYNEKMGENIGRFSRPEFIDDQEVSAALFKTAEKWLQDKSMTKVMGPLGFSNLDTQGLLIEGFDFLPSIASVYHLPYFQKHIEALGYQKEIDWVEFRLTVEAIPEKSLRLTDVIKKRYELDVLSFTSSKEVLKWGDQIFEVLNSAFEDLFAVIQFNDRMKQYYLNKYFKVLNPRLIKLIINKDKKLVAFIVAGPGLGEAMQKANGKLFPFGMFHLMKAIKHPKVIDLLLTGIEPGLQGQGLSALLISELQKTLLELGVEFTETTGIFETNHKAIQHWKNYKHIQHKRRRCFVKTL
ncbi:MAG: hypothetical protein KKA07_09095 [Bacteroidetes bacterium]|nr:hypothetical protein [Bacteroidota bacterium]MBU1719216.1 hypothetical protein [Bacteroidota bacterium]